MPCFLNGQIFAKPCLLSQVNFYKILFIIASFAKVRRGESLKAYAQSIILNTVA